MRLTARQRQWSAPGAVILGVLLCAVILLRAEGRLWICSCGRLLLWSGQVCSANNSQQFLDPFSFTHVLHGLVYFWLLSFLFKRISPAWRLSIAVALAATWEVFENSAFIIGRYRADTASLGYSGDTIVNSLGDIFCCVVGFAIARRLGFRRSLILFAAVEVVLLLWIRDSLLLEILMLVHPVSAIKAWQICR